MDRLAITQRIEIIKIYYTNGYSATAMYRILRGDYGFHNNIGWIWIKKHKKERKKN